MKDPFSPDDAYEFFEISPDANLCEIEKAFFDFCENNHNREIEAVEKEDELRFPEKRLITDILYYYQSNNKKNHLWKMKPLLPDITEEDLISVKNMMCEKLKKLALLSMTKKNPSPIGDPGFEEE